MLNKLEMLEVHCLWNNPVRLRELVIGNRIITFLFEQVPTLTKLGILFSILELTNHFQPIFNNIIIWIVNPDSSEKTHTISRY